MCRFHTIAFLIYLLSVLTCQNLSGLVNVGLGQACLSADMNEVVFLPEKEVGVIVKDDILVIDMRVPEVFPVIGEPGLVKPVPRPHTLEVQQQPFLNLVAPAEPVNVETLGGADDGKLKTDLTERLDAVLAPTGTDNNLGANVFQLVKERDGSWVNVARLTLCLVIKVVTIDDTININPPSEEDKAFPGFST